MGITTKFYVYSKKQETDLLIKYAQYFSLFEENDKRVAKCFLSSNNHVGIKSSSYFLLKFLIVFSIHVLRILRLCI